ncbi:MAG TPA: hypothetical protein VJZ50_04440, partial [Candidatus Limnocylindrales bacterium]|nr:hypothetical protein [Candidatus Limnocylindrales bacterium]
MGSAGLERGFALVVGGVLIVLGLAGSVGNPIVGRSDTTGVFVTGFGHDLVHLVCGALFVHMGIALSGRQRAYGLVGLGVFFVLTGLLSLVSTDLVGLYDAPTTGFDQLAHLLLGVAAVVIGWMGRGVERR